MSIITNDTGELAQYVGTLFDYNSPYTVMAWLRPDAVNAAYHHAIFVYHSATTTNRDHISINDFGQWYVGAYYSTGSNIAGASATQGQWTHIAMVRDAVNSLRLYINGSLSATNTTNITGRTPAADTISFGGFTTGNADELTGAVAHAKAWNTNLSVGEIQSEMRQIAPVRQANLWAYWPLILEV